MQELKSLANNLKKRKHPAFKAKWPITITTDQGTMEAESCNITVSGLFIYCVGKLHRDEICRMVIKPPEQRSIEVKGKVMWSNLDSSANNGALSSKGYSFVKISHEDRRRLYDAVLAHRQ
jgi:hypothetical protein